MSKISKSVRTQITDLPELSVELSERELRIVSGGLRSLALSCNTRYAIVSADRTQYNTSGDWDND